MTEKALKEAVREWANMPSVNRRYGGATPTEVGRALLNRRPVTPERKVAEDDRSVESGV